MSKRNKIILWSVIIFALFVSSSIMRGHSSNTEKIVPEAVYASPVIAPTSVSEAITVSPSPTPALTMITPQNLSVSLWEGFPASLKSEINNAEANEDCDYLEELAYDLEKYNTSAFQMSRMQSHIYDVMDGLYCEY